MHATRTGPAIVILILWGIAIVVTLLLIDSPDPFTKLGPLYFICLVGTLWATRFGKRRAGDG